MNNRSAHPIRTDHENTGFKTPKRSSIDESEGSASVRVRGWEEALARARTGARFRHFVGRNTIRQNFDQSVKDKVDNAGWAAIVWVDGQMERPAALVGRVGGRVDSFSAPPTNDVCTVPQEEAV